MNPLRLLAILLSFLCVSCSATHHASGRVTKRGSVQVFHDAEDSGDENVRAAIRSELIQRGFTLTESNQSDYVAQFKDTWRWNVIMYLARLDVNLIERRTGSVEAQGVYRNGALQSYSDVKKVVKQVFVQMDQDGVFSR